MPVVKFSLQRVMDRLGKAVEADAVADGFNRMGAPVDAKDGDEWALDVSPNRPDLLSAEGLARALRPFLGLDGPTVTYQVRPGDIELRVDPSVAPVRPAMVAAVVRGLRIDERALEDIMALQEDLHWGPGARRRKVSIGVHDLAGVKPPFTYRAADPDSVRFIPLHTEDEMSMREVIERHEKGVAFAHLVDGLEVWPVIEDADGAVLSFPPIINGDHTTLTPGTTDVFLDVTGTDLASCVGVLNIVATHLGEMGGAIESVRVSGPDGPTTYPDLAPARHDLSLATANRLLGTDLDAQAALEALGRMGLAAEANGDDIVVDVPAYRLDVLHEVDLVEEVAIGHGYDNLTDQVPGAVLFAEAMPGEVRTDRVRRVMVGLGHLETMGLTIIGQATTARSARDGSGWPPEQVLVRNPVSNEHDRLRASLLPSLIALAGRNVHRELPQSFFEVGDVVVPAPDRPHNARRLGALTVASDASLTAIKRVAEAVLRELGLTWTEAAVEHPFFVPGRCAEVRDGDGAVLGHYGEVAPEVIVAHGLQNPVAALELGLWPLPPAEVWTPAADPGRND